MSKQAVSSRVRSGWMAIFIAGMVAPCFYAYGAGATTPFKTYEAEDGALGGGATVLSMTTLPTKPTVQLESSGRKCVELNATGESVTWTTTAECNAIVIRASIPDAATGGGISGTLNVYVDGALRQAISMSSKYSWIYGVESFTNNNPSAGTPKRFYDTYRAFISGAAVPAGSTIMLKKDSDNTAAYYQIDLIQLENVGPALTQPANTLSVTAYGATGSDTTDDSTAFNNCIKACESQKKGMWIPAGKFYTKGVVFADDINIYGAGMWYTENHRIIGARHKWDLGNCTIQDLYITVPETGKTLATGHDYGLNMSGAGGWLAQRVWIHRAGACFWLSGTDGTIKDCRSTESWADGINLNNGSVIDATKRGIRLTATNNYIIGSADDGIALNAQNGGGVTYNMVDTKIMNNTSIAVNWANGMRVAGGRNTLLQNNLITDPTDSNGIRVGQFGADGSPCESLLVSDNVILRGCGIRTRYGHGGIAVTDGAKATVNSNQITDSPGLGMDVQNCTATFENNIIERPALQGFLVKKSSVGSGIFNGNTVTGLASGMVAFRNDATSTFTDTCTGNSWQANVTLPVVSFLAPVNLTVQQGTSLYVNVSATDPDGISRVYLSKNGVPLARSEGGAPYEWNAVGQNDPELQNLQPGTFTLTAKAVDTVGSYTEKTITITVQGANQPPYFTSNPFSTADATVGVAYDEPFGGEAIDPEGGTKTFSKVSGPEWLSVTSGGNAQGTPGSVDVGTNSFLVKVTDVGGLTGTATMTVKVVAPVAPPQTVTFTSIGAEDGYLNESTETSNIGGGFNATGAAGAGLRIGDTTTKQQHKSVVSFDTSSIPDGAVIQSATLKLMRGAVSGTPTTLGLINVDIKGGTGFNSATALTKEDFQAAAEASNVATMSYPSANGTLSTGSLNATGLTKVNKTGKTQLRIYFATDDDNDTTSDYLGFYPAENGTAANRPVLEITYQ